LRADIKELEKAAFRARIIVEEFLKGLTALRPDGARMNKSAVHTTAETTSLLIEDDESARKSCRDLCAPDFSFVAVESGEQAVSFAATTHFDIAFVESWSPTA